MSKLSGNSNLLNNPLPDSSRCQQRSPSGRRCRMPVSDAQVGLCAHHARLHRVHQEADLSATLVGELKKFESAGDVNDVLSRLLILASQDRVSPRRASVMAYICNLLLRSVPKPEEESPQFVFDMPDPDNPSVDPPAEPRQPSPYDYYRSKT